MEYMGFQPVRQYLILIDFCCYFGLFSYPELNSFFFQNNCLKKKKNERDLVMNQKENIVI